jgi:GH25 family lysozyme M1 (1,4-beta-N-acetylmuramidase)
MDEHFKPVMDIEGYLPSGMSRATANGMIENFLNRVEGNLGRPCVIYSSKNYISQLYFSTAPAWLRTPARRKWIAGYPTYPNNYSDMPLYYQPNGVDIADTDLWQYSDKAAVFGITGAVDVSDMSDAYEAKWQGGCL